MAKQGHPLYSSKDPYSAETDARGISPAVFAPTSYMGAADYVTTQQEAVKDGRGLGGSGAVGFVTIWTGPSTTGIDQGFKYDTATDIFTLTGRIQMTSAGTRNTFVGVSAGAAITSGADNTAFGYQALKVLTTNFQNVAIGSSALESALGADSNVAVGYYALQATTSGDSNVAIGDSALSANLTGSNNVAVGFGALINSTASSNTAVGYSALGSTVAGTSNAALGFNALGANSSGGQNTAVGATALDASSTVSDSTALGYDSLGASTGAQNTGVGSLAGNTITTGSTCTFLGYNADAASNALTNATALGANALVVASSYAVIGESSHCSLAGTHVSTTEYQHQAIKFATATLASVNGATVTSTGLIPAKAFVVGVTTRVSVALGTGSGTTGYTVGDGSDADRWGAVTGTAVGTDTDGNDATANPTGWFTAANDVVITAAGGNFNGTGSIVVYVFYLLAEAD